MEIKRSLVDTEQENDPSDLLISSDNELILLT